MQINNRNNITLCLLYFFLSTMLTWFFIKVSPLYISQRQMLLSTVIAGGKWAIQIVAALLLLQEKKWLFVKNIGLVCLIGSIILVPYIILAWMNVAAGANFFLGSLIAAVLVMIIYYYRAVIKTQVPKGWWYGWLVCLAIAVCLQLTVVFHAFGK